MVKTEKDQLSLRLQARALFLEQRCNPMLGQIYLACINPKRFGDLANRPVAQHVKLEHLILLGADLALHSLEGGVKNMKLPLLLPIDIDAHTGGIGNTVDGRS